MSMCTVVLIIVLVCWQVSQETYKQGDKKLSIRLPGYANSTNKIIITTTDKRATDLVQLV